jgi:O-antigen/teichoic acid export membrane protein
MDQVVKKGAIMLMLKLVAAALALYLHFLLANQLTAEQFGLFSLVSSIGVFALTFAKQGLEQVTVKLMAKSSTNQISLLYGAIFLYALMSSLLVVALTYVLLFYFSELLFNQLALQDFAILLALLTLLQTWVAINSSVFVGRGHALTALVINGLSSVALTIVFVVFYSVSNAFQAILYVTIAYCISAALSFYLLSKRYKGIFNSGSNEYITSMSQHFDEIHSLSKRLLIVSLAALATQQFSIIVMGRYVSLSDIGSFNLALKITLLLSYPLIVINTITAPKYATLYHEGKLIEFKQLAVSTRNILLCIATLGLIVFYLTIDGFMRTFNDSYTNVVFIAKVLVIGQWFNLATGSVVSMLIMAGFEKIHQRNTLILTALNIIALLIFIPIYGAIAAAIITAMAMAIKNLVAMYFVYQLIFSQCSRAHS